MVIKPDRNEWYEKVCTHLLESAELKRQTVAECTEAILQAAVIISGAFKEGKKVLLCGNGGSAADCQHMATEFVSRLNKEVERPGLPAIALTTDTSFLTAFSNDYDFGGVFERQVNAIGKPGDVLIAISTSGESVNIIRAAKAARVMEMRIIALTGRKGQLGGLADTAIRIPSADTQYIQETHLAVEHILCELVESWLFPSNKS